MIQSGNYASLPSIFRGKQPTLEDFGSLLNLMPEAALLVDKKRSLILYANSELLKVSAFSLRDLIDRPLSELFDNARLETVEHGAELSAVMLRRKRDPIKVRLQLNGIDAAGQWAVLMVDIPKTTSEFGSPDQDTDLQRLLELTRLVDSSGLDHLMQEMLRVIQGILKTDLICVYQAVGNYPQLCKMVSSEAAGIFPDNIPSTDLIRLAATNIWTSGKRVQTELHRAGRMANLAQVISTRLGNENASFGLLVAGFAERQSRQQLDLLFEFVANYLSSNLQHFTLVDNLKKERDQSVKMLRIRNDLQESIKEGVLVLTPDLRVADMNPAAELILGYAEAEVRGHLADNILITPEGLMPALEAASSGMKMPGLSKVSLLKRDGQLFPANIQIIPTFQVNTVQAIQVVITDLSENEQIRARTQHLEQQAAIGEVTAVFAHEVRNPINNISTGLQLLATRLTGEDRNQELIGRMQSDCIRLNDLMESVLSFSRPMDIRLQPVNLDLLLRRVIDRWRPRMTRLRVEPYYQSADQLPFVRGDSRSLEQVFTNLISNAVEVMHDTGGTLAIQACISEQVTNPPQIEITVTDNGPGIPDEIKSRLFEPFVSNRPRGTGLGLAITKQIVTAHRGSIYASSFPGGTVFHVLIPVDNGENS
ncbi:MAG: PAS domain S-box protein [Chloroflexi bacterium]|nr:PAS domain S-box protein [Chloroflexota bacterium]